MSESDVPEQEAPEQVEGDAQPPENEGMAEAVAPAVLGSQRYDISSKERVVAERMPTMDIVNERFGRYLQSGLFSLLRRHADVSAGRVTVQRHGAFMSALALPTHFNLVSLRSLRGNGLVVCETPLLFGLVETLYGGPGVPRTDLEPRDLSATEQRVLHRLVQVVCAEYQKAWKGIHAMALDYVRLESLPQFASIAGPNEIVVSTAFEITVGELKGLIHLCVPYLALEPLRDVLYASPLGDADSVDRRWLSMLTREIQSAEVNLVAQLATAEVTVAQLLSMKPGDFIELDRVPRIQASVDGVPLFSCHYGINQGKYAIRVDQCLTAPGEDHGH
jgi:flagellar motor switch protein FliM